MSQVASAVTAVSSEWNLPVSVKSRGRYRIWLAYEDGEEGEVDLSDMAGEGPFLSWDKDGGVVFDQVYLHPAGFISWPDGIDLDTDALYSRMTGRPLDEVVPDEDSGSYEVNERPLPERVESRGRYRIWLRFGDGEEGEVDLSDMARSGVFHVWDWDEGRVFDDVRVGRSGEIIWPYDIDLDPDVLYSRMTGIPITQIVPWAEPE